MARAQPGRTVAIMTQAAAAPVLGRVLSAFVLVATLAVTLPGTRPATAEASTSNIGRNDSAIVAAASQVNQIRQRHRAALEQVAGAEELAVAWEGGRSYLDQILARAEQLETMAYQVSEASDTIRAGESVERLLGAEETIFAARGMVANRLRGVEGSKLRAPELVAALNNEGYRLRGIVAGVETGLGDRPDLSAVTGEAAAVLNDRDSALSELANLTAEIVNADAETLYQTWVALDDRRLAAVLTGLEQLGKPYVFAARGPNSFDCSGLTAVAWAAGGRRLTPYSYAQQSETTPVAFQDMIAGDLIFWDRRSIPEFTGAPGHVAMYLGTENLIVEANGVGYVRIWRLSTPYLSGYGHVNLPGESWQRTLPPAVFKLPPPARQPAVSIPDAPADNAPGETSTTDG